MPEVPELDTLPQEALYPPAAVEEPFDDDANEDDDQPNEEPAKKRKRGRGRPQGAKNKETDKADPKIDSRIPDSPPDPFWQKVAAITDWSYHRWYLWRFYPKISRQLTGHRYNYIDRVDAKPCSKEHILRVHGGGVYQVSIHDRKRKSGHQEILRCVNVDLDHTQWPPRLDPTELVTGHPTNAAYEDYLRVRNEHPEQRGLMTANQQGNQNQNDKVLNTLLSTVLQILQKPGAAAAGGPVDQAAIGILSKAYQEAISTAVKQNDPANSMTLLTQARDLFQNNQPKGEGGEILKLVMGELASMRQQNTDLMKELIGMKTKPAPDAMDQVKNIGAIAKELRGLFGPAAAAADADPKSALWNALADAVPQLAEPLMQLATLWLTSGGVAAFANAGARRQPAPIAGAPPPAQRPPTRPLPPGAQGNGRNIEDVLAGNPAAPDAPDAPAGAPADQPGDQAPLVLNDQERAIVLQFGTQVLDALERDIPGDDWAEGFITLYGPRSYHMVRNLGIEGIVQRFRAVPELWPRLQPFGETLLQFVAEFIDGAGPYDEDPAPPEPPAPPPQAEGFTVTPNAAPAATVRNRSPRTPRAPRAPKPQQGDAKV